MHCSRSILLALTLLTLTLAGCPWSKAPDVFDSAKGISMPNFGGPPPQTEPDFVDEDSSTVVEE